MHFFL